MSSKTITQTKLFDPSIIRNAVIDAFKKLNPAVQIRNPVMFIVAVGALLSTFTLVRGLIEHSFSFFNFQIVLWLWFTLLFANLAEAMAEGRGKAQAASLRKAVTGLTARRVKGYKDNLRVTDIDINDSSFVTTIPSGAMQKGDYVVCKAGDIIPGDG